MRRRLALHGLVLAGVLAAVHLLIGTDGLISADEGAMLAQLDLLDRTGEWTMPNPEPIVDPDMDALPLELSDRTADGRWSPFVKHPAHIAVLRPAWTLGGYGAAVAMSLAGVVAAAVAAALLAGRLRPGTELPALWLTGLGSPLLFDGFQVVGHALGAASFGLAGVSALAALDGGRRWVAWAAAAAALVAAGGLVRTEAVLAGVALGAAVAAFGAGRRRAVALGAALIGAAVAVYLLEPKLVSAMLGGGSRSVRSAPSSGSDSFLSERWAGFKVSVLDAGYGVDAGEVLLLVSLLLAVVAALAWRLRGRGELVRLLAVASMVAAVGRMVAADFLVPGLLAALPLAAVSVVSLRVEHLRSPTARTLWAAVALFGAAVAATQYETGGTGEWGGRYFAVALPLLVAVAIHVTWSVADAMDPRTRRVAGAWVAVVAASLAVGAVRAAEGARHGSDAVADAVIAEVDRLGVEATLSTRGAVSRFAWEDVLDGRRWFTTTTDESLAALGAALDAEGVTRVALVVPASADPESLLGEGWEVADAQEVRPGTVVALATNTRSPE